MSATLEGEEEVMGPFTPIISIIAAITTAYILGKLIGYYKNNSRHVANGHQTTQ